MFYKNHELNFAFGYQISIENQGNTTVQLISRYWTIKDSLNETEIVQGEGVIGKQPILKPGETHTYQSGCLLHSPFGSMSGYYTMQDSGKKFKVKIPNFKLFAPYAVN